MDLTGNLVSFWELEEASGTRADSKGSNSLSDNNTVTQAGGIIGNAALFTRANSEWLQATSNSSTQIGDVDFTIVCWVYLNTVMDGTGTNFQMMIAEDDGTNRSFSIAQGSASTAEFEWRVFRSGGSAICRSLSFTTPVTATWYMLTCEYTSSGTTCGIAVNNGTVDSLSVGGAHISSTGDLFMGKRNSTGSEGYYDGRLDQVGLWTRLLNSTEKSFLYNSGAGRAYSELVPDLILGQVMM